MSSGCTPIQSPSIEYDQDTHKSPIIAKSEEKYFPQIQGNNNYISGIGIGISTTQEKAEEIAQMKSIQELVKRKTVFVISIEEFSNEKLEVNYEMLINEKHFNNIITLLSSVSIQFPQYKYQHYEMSDGKYKVVCIAYKQVNNFINESLSSKYEKHYINELLNILVTDDNDNRK